jgi:hypothetical protein
MFTLSTTVICSLPAAAMDVTATSRATTLFTASALDASAPSVAVANAANVATPSACQKRKAGPILPDINQISYSATGAWRYIISGLPAFSKQAFEYSMIWLAAGHMVSMLKTGAALHINL